MQESPHRPSLAIVSPKSARLAVALATGAKKVFASAADWAGWSRSAKTDEAAIEALLSYAPRYAAVANLAGASLPENHEVDVIERAEGGSGTDFGVPSRVTAADARPVSRADAERLAALVEAAWTTFDRVAGGAPAELRRARAAVAATATRWSATSWAPTRRTPRKSA